MLAFLPSNTAHARRFNVFVLARRSDDWFSLMCADVRCGRRSVAGGLQAALFQPFSPVVTTVLPRDHQSTYRPGCFV